MQSKETMKKIGLDAYTALGKSHQALEEHIAKLEDTIKNGRLSDKEWVTLVRKMVKFTHKYEDMRAGQAYMNALYEVSPKLYNEITGTSADCFYVDFKLHKFMQYLNGAELDEN